MSAVFNDVQVQSDTRSLLNALKATFTSSTTVLGELLQNARRAGATKVEIECTDDTFTVIDDGCGIDDMSVLLSIALSGWDKAVQEQESPYGIGFLSTLFACESITITSNGMMLRALTKDLLEIKPASVTPVACDGRTRISLTGYDFGVANGWPIAHELRVLATGFPIPVIFNGEELDRKHAASDADIKTNIGLVSEAALFSEPYFYLQGLPIDVKGFRRDFRKGHVHLDPVKFKGRMPDRDILINPDACSTEIRGALQEAAKSFLQRRAKEMDARSFVDQYGQAATSLGLFELLNSLDFVPASWFKSFEDEPMLGDESISWLPEKGVWSKDELKAAKVFACDVDDCYDSDDLVPLRYIHQVAGLVLDREAPGHWVNEIAVKLGRDDLQVVVEGEIGRDEVELDGCRTKVVIASQVILRSEREDLADVEVGSAYCQDRYALVVSPGTPTYVAVRQVYYFYDQADSVDDNLVSEGASILEQLIDVIVNKDDPSKIIYSAIRRSSFHLPKLLHGKTFKVVIDENGELSVEQQ